MGNRVEEFQEAWSSAELLELLGDCCGQLSEGCGKLCAAHSLYLRFEEAARLDKIEEYVLLAVGNKLMDIEVAKAIFREKDIDPFKLEALEFEMRPRQDLLSPSF